MTLYEFWTISGNHLENITTDTPEDHIGELAHLYGVDADEIEWMVYDPIEWGEDNKDTQTSGGKLND
jgi:hypothetical protein